MPRPRSLESCLGHAAAQANPNGRAQADAFAPKNIAMTRRFADGVRLDFADASFAELLARSLAQKAGESLPVPPERIGAAAGERVGDA